MKLFYKTLKFITIFSIILAWAFNFPPVPFLKNFGGQGWPQIFNFPPEIKMAYAIDTTPTIAGTGANATGIGTVVWTTPEEITVGGGGNDSVYAVAALAKSEISNYLKATNFGFSIPDGSTIQGIKVEVDRKEGNTAAAGGVIDNTVQLIDETGAIRTTVNKADIVTFWPTADGTVIYGGVADLWGEASGFWTTAKINDLDFGVAFVSENKKVSGGGAAESAHVDFVRVTVTYGPASITVGTTGTQTATMSIPSTNQYVGGAFTFVRSGGTANVTSVVISETGTVNANANLSNVQLYYKQEVSCSASIPVDATVFNATGVGFDASENATVTGTMAVGTSQICVYVELDVGAGASDSQTLEIEITNPSTEVIVSAGDVTPATAVAISGATTLNLPVNVFQDHYRWRNDNGPQGDTSQTLYFNPTGNGFAMNFTIVGGCTAGSEWDCVDDGTADTQSTAPTSDLETSQLKSVNGKSYYTLINDALPAGATVTQLDITASGVDDVGNPNTSLTLGYCTTCDGANDVMGTAQAVTGADQTKTQQFASLSLSTTDMNNMQLVVQGSGVNAEISTLYVLVTYTVPAATWRQAEDIVETGLAKSTNIRLRFQIDNTGGTASAYNYRLEWAAQSGTCDTAYTGESYAAVPDVPTTQHFDMTLSGSSLFVDGDPTTAQLSNAEAFTFVAGNQVESTSNQSGAITLAQNQYTEVEYVFQANTNATDGGVYCFRVTNAGTALNSADVIAQVTLAGGGGATLTFSISDVTIGFGNLSSTASRWATGDLTGNAAATVAHTITASTNSTSGYTITVNGATLASTGTPADTITAMATEATLTTGQEEFGLRITASGGSGVVDAVYDDTPANSYALVTSAFPDTIATSSGASTDTTYSLYYAANISATTEAHTDYSSTLTYIITGNF